MSELEFTTTNGQVGIGEDEELWVFGTFNTPLDTVVGDEWDLTLTAGGQSQHFGTLTVEEDEETGILMMGTSYISTDIFSGATWDMSQTPVALTTGTGGCWKVGRIVDPDTHEITEITFNLVKIENQGE